MSDHVVADHDGQPKYNSQLCIQLLRASLTTLLVQSGKRWDGFHIPFSPQVHTSSNIFGEKVHSSLHNGMQKRPKIQSSHALAPLFGAVRFLQALAGQR